MPKERGPSVRIEIQARHFPGSSCGPGPKGESFNEIQVGLARGKETIDFVPGDAQEARWSFEVAVRPGGSVPVDFIGPFVLGSKEDRHFGIRWITLSSDSQPAVFRAAKLRVSDIGPGLVHHAIADNRPLIGRLTMTDRQGLPICARVRPPDIEWSLD